MTLSIAVASQSPCTRISVTYGTTSTEQAIKVYYAYYCPMLIGVQVRLLMLFMKKEG